MGGAVVDWAHPMDGNEWFDDNDAFGVLRVSDVVLTLGFSGRAVAMWGVGGQGVTLPRTG